MRTTPIAVILLAGLAAAPAHAQPAGAPAPAGAPGAKADGGIKLGGPAPAFKVERFMKGRPFAKFETGRVYVVEFWATWSGPSVMMIGRLSALQRDYRSKGVTVVGVNVRQDKTYTSDTVTTVSRFVDRKGEAMDYSVAYDGATGFMDSAWLRGAGRDAVPCAFVVDKAGNIAWYGHPRMLDMVVDEVTRETWDTTNGPNRLKAAVKAFGDAGEKYKESVAAGDRAWAEAMKTYPALGKTMGPEKFVVMLKAGRVEEACRVGADVLATAKRYKDSGRIQELLGGLNDNALLKVEAARKLLLDAAEANLELADPDDATPRVLVARAYFYNGEAAKGHAAVARAVELTPANTRMSVEAWLRQIEAEASAAVK